MEIQLFFTDKFKFIESGSIFKAGDLDIGVYELNTKIILAGLLYWEWTIFSEIAECWH